MYKQFIQLSIKNKQSNKKLAKDLNVHFSTEGMEMAIKYKKRWSESLVLREEQLNGPMR